MSRIWREIKDHRLASAIFLLYWVAVYGLYLSRWNAPKDTPDLARPVLELHVLLPLAAGAVISWWRRSGPGRITGAMAAGATVLFVDHGLVLGYGLILNRFWAMPGGKAPLLMEHLAFLIASGVVGAVLGAAGAAAGVTLRWVLGHLRIPVLGRHARSPAMWNEIRDHWPCAAPFLAYWLIVFGLDVLRWHKPENRPDDMIQSVLYLHLLLPAIAGVLVFWWRRAKPAGVTGAMFAGAAVLILDAAAVLTWHFFDFRYWESSGNESVFELPVLVIALGLLGALLGLMGAAGATALGSLLDRWRRPPPTGVSLFRRQPGEGDGGAPVQARPGGAEGINLRRPLHMAAGLTCGVAAAVLFRVIPLLAADNIARTAPRAVPAFAVVAMLNMLIAVVLLASASRQGAGQVLMAVAGFAALLLGCALLDAASAFLGHGPARRAAALLCLSGAAGDLGAGVLALLAAFRRRESESDGTAKPHNALRQNKR